jgi:hypothetical protein
MNVLLLFCQDGIALNEAWVIAATHGHARVCEKLLDNHADIRYMNYAAYRAATKAMHASVLLVMNAHFDAMIQ